MPPADADIETVPFADGCLARNLATGALCRLNGTAATILDWIAAGASEAEAASRLADLYGIDAGRAGADVGAIVQAWRESNLLAPEPEAGPDDGLPAAGSMEPFDASLDICVSCGGAPVRVRCAEKELSDLLAAVMAPAEVRPAPAEPPAGRQCIELAGADGDFRCWCDGTLMWRTGPRPLARRLLLQDVIGRSLPGERLSAILHASAVVVDGRTVILAGASGSGKSTLTAGLAASGGRLVADDLLPFVSADDGVLPVPFAISVKEGSWPVLEPLFEDFGRLEVFTSRGMKVRYLAPAMAETGRTARPDLIVFPQFSASGPATAEALGEAAVADALIETGTDLTGMPGALAEFAALTANVAGYRIGYATLGEAIELVRSLTKR